MVKDASTEALALTIACRSSLEHLPHPITLIASNGPHLVPSKATRRQALGTPLAIEHISARFAQKEIGHPVFDHPWSAAKAAACSASACGAMTFQWHAPLHRPNARNGCKLSDQPGARTPRLPWLLASGLSEERRNTAPCSHAALQSAAGRTSLSPTMVP
jgi:hypothetical protein